jgi:signal transduction histidine kinase
VGLILADAGSDLTGEASFLEFAATLGNSAALAIANARLHALLLQHRGELRELSSRGLAVVEDIMRRISREMHDNTCQVLMAIKLDLALLERQLGGEAGALRGAVRDIGTRVVEVMHGVRQMSHLIHPAVLDDFGAVAAIETVAAKYKEASGLPIEVECSDPGVRFTPEVELLLFRVFQEALTNVVKHAGATRVSVRVAVADDAVRLEIEDDGQGFDAVAFLRAPPPGAGIGLLGMRERVGYHGGTFRVVSRRGAGTRIMANVPARPVVEATVASAV